MRQLLPVFAVLAVTAAADLRTGGAASGPDFQLNLDYGTFESPPTPSDFASFSYEVPCAPLMFSHKSGSDHWPWNGNHPQPGPWAPRNSYANLLNLLRSATNGTRGPNIRIGGNSADMTWFATLPDGPNGPNGDNNKVTVQDIATYAYVSQWNGTVAIDININQGHNTTNSVEYAVAAMELLDPAIISGFEVGNEPDLFGQNGIRPSNWSYDEYNRLFQRYADALQTQGKMQMPRIQGAVFACCYTNHLDNYTIQWTTPGPVGTDKQNLLTTVSQHHYPMSSKSATIEKLMAPEASSGVWMYHTNANVARAQGIPFVIGEGNSAFDGGKEGVSNAFAATLWGIDTMSYAARGNMSRWNFHGCPEGAYTPIAINHTSHGAEARALFYGMWFFSRFTANEARFISSSIQNNVVPNLPNIAGSATLDKYRTLRVALLQKTANNATTTTVRVNLGNDQANKDVRVFRLEATTQKLSETRAIKFGGLSLNGVSDGVPVGTPHHDTIVADAQGTVTVELVPASAALLELSL